MERQEETQPQASVTELPPQVRDLTGQRFSKLVVQTYVGRNKKNRPQWLCLCDCGNTKVVLSESLIYENTKSCGCLVGKNNKKGERKDKPVKELSTTPLKKDEDIEQEPTHTWRAGSNTSHLNNNRLEQHPNGLWKYPGTRASQFVPLPPHLMPPDFIPNYITNESGVW